MSKTSEPIANSVVDADTSPEQGTADIDLTSAVPLTDTETALSHTQVVNNLLLDIQEEAEAGYPALLDELCYLDVHGVSVDDARSRDRLWKLLTDLRMYFRLDHQLEIGGKYRCLESKQVLVVEKAENTGAGELVQFLIEPAIPGATARVRTKDGRGFPLEFESADSECAVWRSKEMSLSAFQEIEGRLLVEVGVFSLSGELQTDVRVIEIESVGDEEVLGWLEDEDGDQLKTIFDRSMFSGMCVEPGDLFLWSESQNAVTPMPTKDSLLREEIEQEEAKLQEVQDLLKQNESSRI